MNRVVKPELLDTLLPNDPDAIRSRRDLRRINTWMRHPDLMALELQKEWRGKPHEQITELGAGDGHFLLQVARKIKAGQTSRLAKSIAIKVILLDRQPTISTETVADFAAMDWQSHTVTADVFNWPLGKNGIVIANLFLHHFEDARLTKLLGLISQSAEIFIALEPRRATWPLFCSRLLWIIGCNHVTRHDAVASVRAGFDNDELSARWPDKGNWRLMECRAGPFSHLFIAQKIS